MFSILGLLQPYILSNSTLYELKSGTSLACAIGFFSCVVRLGGKTRIYGIIGIMLSSLLIMAIVYGWMATLGIY